MTEKQGFLNAPTVTEFAVGMVVFGSDGESLGTVVRIDEGEGARVLRYADTLYRVTEAIPKLRLDLSPERMWAGREYRSKCNGMLTARIVAPPEFTNRGGVWVLFEADDGGFCRWSVKDFLGFYEPVPLNEAEPKVEMSDDEKMEDVCRRVVRSLVREWLVNMNAQIFAAGMSGKPND